MGRKLECQEVGWEKLSMERIYGITIKEGIENMLTEKEALQCWCPMARVYTPECAINREGHNFAQGSSRWGSACMMWIPEPAIKGAARDLGQADRGDCGLKRL
jgi:hypothetical protein